MLARALSLLFFATILLSFFSVRYASFSLLIFVLIGFVVSFLNGNKSKLFVGSVLLFLVVLSSFFIHFKQVSQNENELAAINSAQNLELKYRLSHIKEIAMADAADEKPLLSYIYESITAAENIVNKDNPESYLYLAYIYQAANRSGIESANEKANDNFVMYCQLTKTDILKICQKN